MVACKCGCGEPVKAGRVFVNKEHQLTWMNAGGARETGALQPREAKVKGGQVAGHAAAASGRLLEAAQQGGAKSHAIAAQMRATRGTTTAD